MFDMRQVAANLKQRRTSKGITQMELADLMGVSYQAVSNWERGNSMPDIGKLPDLAEIFSCQIDDLIGHSPEAEFIQKIEAEEEVVPETAVLKETAAILKPEQVADYSRKIAEEKKLFLSDIIDLAPFLEQEVLDDLLSCLDYSLDQVKFSEIISLAPFVGRETLGQITKHYLEQNPQEELDLNTLVEIAPFLHRELLCELFCKVNLSQYKITFWNLQCLAPFMDRRTFSDLTMEFLRQSNHMSGSELLSIAPFLEKETVGTCVKEIFSSNEKDKISAEELSAVAPFMGKDK